MSDEYFVKVRDKIRGPFNFAKLRQLAGDGKLKPTHAVSLDQHEWINADQLPMLSFAVDGMSRSHDGDTSLAPRLHRIVTTRLTSGRDNVIWAVASRDVSMSPAQGFGLFVFGIVTAGVGLLLIIPMAIIAMLKSRQYVVGLNSSEAVVVQVNKRFEEVEATVIPLTSLKAKGLRDVLTAYKGTLAGRDQIGHRVKYHLFIRKNVKGIPDHKDRAAIVFRMLKAL